MRLLAAELRKLRRPLVVWTFVALSALIGLIGWQQLRNVAQQRAFVSEIGPGPLPQSCAQIGMPPGPACDQQLAEMKAGFCQGQGVSPGPLCDRLIASQTDLERREAQDQARRLASQFADAQMVQSPIGSAVMAGGFLASLFGAVAILLVAAAHVGNEWSGHTIKQVLAQEGRRWRVLVAKLLTLWAMAVALLLVVWGVLAMVGTISSAVNHLPGTGPTVGQAVRAAGPVVARSLLVMLAFSALGLLAAAITRNTLGSFFLGFAFVIASLILAGSKGVGRFSLAYWVTGWMGFHQGEFITTNFWRDQFDPLGYPSHVVGLVGLLAFVAACVGLAVLRTERSDVKA